MIKLIDGLEGMEIQRIQGSDSVLVEDVIYDSRKAKENQAFVCMRGTNVDSHGFAKQVYDQGTRVFVVEQMLDLPEDATIILVKDGREALARLSAAVFGHPADKLILIGITGTKGKTTTTHMVKAILEADGCKVGTIGTNGVTIGKERYNTVNTTPESYELHKYFAQMLAAGCTHCVMEVSSQAFKMSRVAGITFNYSIFNNISPDHIGPGEHADFEEYFYFKKQIFQCSKVALYNYDDDKLRACESEIPCEHASFGIKDGADYFGSGIKYLNQGDFVGVGFQVKGKFLANARINLPGRFNVSNALAAIGVANEMGISNQSILKGLSSIVIDGRMEIVYSSDEFCVIVDYAHNEVSMKALLETLKEYRPTRLVCVFGCGGNRAKERRYSMGRIAGQMADFSVLTADNSRYEKTEDIIADIRGCVEESKGSYIEILDRRDAITYCIEHAQKGDMIAIIGKGHEDYQEVEGVRTPFLDKQVVLEAIGKGI